MGGLVNAIGFVWALPATAVGLIIAAASLGRGSWRRGVLWVDASRGAGALVARRPSPAATTFGHAVLLWHPEALDAALEEHELVHVRQYQVLGIFYFPLYLALRARYRTGPEHPLERAAYERGRSVRSGGG